MAVPDPSERTVSELRDDLKEIDDPDELRDLYDTESNGKDRKSARRAIERRLRQVEDEASGDGAENEDEPTDDRSGGEGASADGADDASENAETETPGTSVETAVSSTSRRLDSATTESEPDTEDDSDESDDGNEDHENGGAKTPGTTVETAVSSTSRRLDSATTESEPDGGQRSNTDPDGTDSNEPDASAESDGSDTDESPEDDEARTESTSEQLGRRLDEFGASAQKPDASTNGTNRDENDEDGEPDDENEAAAGNEPDDGESPNETQAPENGEADRTADSSDSSIDIDTDTNDSMSDSETEDQTTRDTETSDEPAVETEDAQRTEASGSGASLIDVRDRVRDTTASLIGRRLDGISGIQREDDGWVAIINMIERRSVPDTQDILGRYEITLDENAEIEGYRRLSRYRRGDTVEEEWQ
jgi:hypothetical protein